MSEHGLAHPAAELGQIDVHLFAEGTHARLDERLGAHPLGDGRTVFRVWAPNARAVSVIGDFNGWHPDAAPMRHRDDGSGIWETTLDGAQAGNLYKYRIATHDGRALEKADPFAFASELPPGTASRIATLHYDWADQDWMRHRARRNALDAPMSIYEVHLGSWRRDDGVLPTYRDIAEPLAEYVTQMGFTHIELMPVTEHPFYGSWGYQTTGYFAASSRYGSPQDLMVMIDTLHRYGIGVILDWVPSHFPIDAHALAQFDGTHLYEHADPRQGFHPEWSSAIFNYGRNEVRAFLLSSALFWLRRYHVDALRVDAVASMLYLDYARNHGEWIPNVHGGRENLEAVEFLHHLNTAVYRDVPDAQTIAEESTAWPGVSRPVFMGGLGFGMKWNMGWMHDTLKYLKNDPVHRRHHHDQLTFSLVYAFHENFVLPLSHDEVVYGKGSLLQRMPGDGWQRFANLRSLFGYFWGHPGKKLLFMGGEFGQWAEWTHEGQLDWPALQDPMHAGLQRWVADLNRIYRVTRALHAIDFDQRGFQWLVQNDAQASVIAFARYANDDDPPAIVVCNFTPVPRSGYRIGAPRAGRWLEALNSDAVQYGGSGVGNLGVVATEDIPEGGHAQSIVLELPPLATVILIHEA